MLSLGAYLTGVVELAAIAAALAFGAVGLRRALVPWGGAPARLVEAVLALSTLLVVSELLGVVGLFEEPALLIACVVVGLAQGLSGGRVLGRLRDRGAASPGEPSKTSNYWRIGSSRFAAG